MLSDRVLVSHINELKFKPEYGLRRQRKGDIIFISEGKMKRCTELRKQNMSILQLYINNHLLLLRTDGRSDKWLSR